MIYLFPFAEGTSIGHTNQNESVQFFYMLWKYNHEMVVCYDFQGYKHHIVSLS
jgi:hypothetical protein